MSEIFIIGIQRSGTNFAEFNCYPGSTPTCGSYFKHDIKRDNKDVECKKIICLIKNPYTWVESICYRGCPDIIRYFPEYQLVDETDFIGPFKINLVRLCNVYKDFYTSWMNYGKIELMHYEELLKRNPDKVHDKVVWSDNWDVKRIKTYLKYKTPFLSEDVINTITETLGRDFIKQIEYPVK